MSGFYDFLRFKIPSRFLKWISRYNFQSEELQNLVSQQPKPVYVISLDLSVAQDAGSPLVLDVPGRGFVAYGYDPTTTVKTRKLNSLVNVRINDNRSEYEFPAKYNRGYHGDFTKLYLNWPAQSGTSADFVIHQFDDMPWETDSLPASSSGTMAIAGTVTGGTTGSVLFVGPGPVLSQDNANFFWDDTNNRLGIGKTNPGTALDVVGSVTATTFVGALTGTASGNTTYTANNHGLVLSSATNAMTVVAPDASTTKALISGGAAADPAWGTLAIGGGGTGQVTKAAAFDALSPMSASGDVIYGGTAGTGTRLAKSTDGFVLTLAAGLPSWAANTPSLNSWAAMTGLVWAGLGTVSSEANFYKIYGDTLYIRGFLICGTVAATTCSVDISGGTGGAYTIKNTKYAATANVQYVGDGRKQTNSSTSIDGGNVIDFFYDGSDTAKLYFTDAVASNTYTKKNGSAIFSASQGFTYSIEVAIS